MKKIESVKEAFELEGLDAQKVEIIGIPDRHIEAVKAIAKLMVVHDHVNPEFDVNYGNHDQPKYELYFYHPEGSPSGVGFRLRDVDHGWACSRVGARLVSESREAGNYIATHPEFEQLYSTFLNYKREIKK